MDRTYDNVVRKDRDRINNLPVELLSRILSLLPTKDAAALRVLSKTFGSAFSLRTSFDFDDSPIIHCLYRPHLIERHPTYERFVDSLLESCESTKVDSVLESCESTKQLTRFKLRLGRDETRCTLLRSRRQHEDCDEACYLEFDPTCLNAWICFPLTRSVKELDLSIHVRKPRGKLPLDIFTCETLQVLKLDVRLDIDIDDDMRPLSFCLPNLKLLHLSAVCIPSYDFATRLVASCPSLEDLTLQNCVWEKEDYMTISSPSLRRLVLDLMEVVGGDKCHEEEATLSVLIDTPNLQHLSYDDNLAFKYTFTPMHSLVTADIRIMHYGYEEESFWTMISLAKSLSNAPCLSFRESCVRVLDFILLEDQLPVFCNLNYLELGFNMFTKWDKVLLEFLKCSPCLETLAFPEGINHDLANESYDEYADLVDSELLCWTTTQTIPLCVWSHLKRVVIKSYFGSRRELEMVNFFLRNASILEELFICWNTLPPSEIDQLAHESELKNLPRASINCSIRVQIDDHIEEKWVVSHPMIPTRRPSAFVAPTHNVTNH